MALYDGLDDAVRAKLRASFAASVSRGEKIPFVIPYSLLGAFIIPTFYLSLSQKRHPWLYTSRWLVAAAVIAFNIHVARHVSSSNLAVSYAAGLLSGWGILYNLNLLIWTRPQATAARIIRRKRNTANGGSSKEYESSTTASRMLITEKDDHNAQPSDLRQRQGFGRVGSHSQKGSADGSSYETPDEVEYVWQPFPHDAPWRERFNWALDLTTSFRGCGWNWAISPLPQPKPPSHVHDITPVDMASWPVESPAGYRRCTTEAEFLRTRLRTVFIMYMLIDLLAITMARDPYFVLGPDQPYETPPHLAWLPSILLLWLRQLMSLTAFFAAILGIMTTHALIQLRLAPHLFPARDQLWHYPSIFGPFSAVLERGLAGWWGQWWHQTFRAQFLAPATYLLREGYTRKGEALSAVLALCITFGQSGLLHAFGSITSIPETRAWRAPVFFALQVVGLILEHALTSALPSGVFGPAKKGQDAKRPSPAQQVIRKLLNLAFAFLWVQWTSIFFCDDIASTGLWLCDPLPFSPLRMLGFGQPGDRWWRWERQHFPGWYSGAHWWESGIAL